jgi:hypothetical protein
MFSFKKPVMSTNIQMMSREPKTVKPVTIKLGMGQPWAAIEGTPTDLAHGDRQITCLSKDDFLAKDGAASGSPTCYFETNGIVMFWPTPDEVIEIRGSILVASVK